MSGIIHDSSTQKNTAKGFSRLFTVIGNLFFGLLLLLIISMVFFLVQSKASGGPPKVFGRNMYIVLSGSMAPTFDTGSVIFVSPRSPEQIQAGDVITFTGVDGSQALTTHRVVDIDKTNPQEIQFITKGDANDVNDPSPVSADRLVGTLSLSIPYLGYLLTFAQTKKGMLILIIVPGVFLIITELQKLYINAKLSRENSQPNKPLQAYAGNETAASDASNTAVKVQETDIRPGSEKDAWEREEEFNSRFWTNS